MEFLKNGIEIDLLGNKEKRAKNSGKPFVIEEEEEDIQFWKDKCQKMEEEKRKMNEELEGFKKIFRKEPRRGGSYTFSSDQGSAYVVNRFPAGLGVYHRT